MTELIIFTSIALALFAGLILCSWAINRHHERELDRWEDDTWAEIIDHLSTPPWDGMTWDAPTETRPFEWFGEERPEAVSWPEADVAGSAEITEPVPYAAWQGEEPEQDPDQLQADIDVFIMRMREDTSAFLATLGK